jgi:hypothetical protein
LGGGREKWAEQRAEREREWAGWRGKLNLVAGEVMH